MDVLQSNNNKITPNQVYDLARADK